jgi:hypothetical protein
VAKTADGNVEAMRALLIAKRSGREARIRCLNQIRHLVGLSTETGPTMLA